jgi:hypothetical protein
MMSGQLKKNFSSGSRKIFVMRGQVPRVRQPPVCWREIAGAAATPSGFCGNLNLLTLAAVLMACLFAACSQLTDPPPDHLHRYGNPVRKWRDHNRES